MCQYVKMIISSYSTGTLYLGWSAMTQHLINAYQYVMAIQRNLKLFDDGYCLMGITVFILLPRPVVLWSKEKHFKKVVVCIFCLMGEII